MLCKDALNAQMQGMERRIKQAENQLTAQYNATSLVVKVLSGIPETSIVGSICGTFLSGDPLGMKTMFDAFALLNPSAVMQLLLQYVIGQIGIPSFASIMNAAQNAIQQAIDQEINALTSLILQNTVQARKAIQEAGAAIAMLKQLTSDVTAVCKSQNDISLCKTISSKIGGF